MKTIALLLTTAALVSPSYAEAPLLWRDGVATPCPQCVARPDPIPFVRPTLGWSPASSGPRPDYVSRSRTTITHGDGSTSTINSTYRSYSR